MEWIKKDLLENRLKTRFSKNKSFLFLQAFDSATLAAAHSKVAIERHQRQSLGSPRISPSKQSKIVDDKEFVGENVDGKEEFLEEENIGELNNNNYQPQRKSSLSDILEVKKFERRKYFLKIYFREHHADLLKDLVDLKNQL